MSEQAKYSPQELTTQHLDRSNLETPQGGNLSPFEQVLGNLMRRHPLLTAGAIATVIAFPALGCVIGGQTFTRCDYATKNNPGLVVSHPAYLGDVECPDKTADGYVLYGRSLDIK